VKPKLKTLFAALAIAGGAFGWAPAAPAHAFPEQEEPAVGAVLHESPKQVRIRFDSRIEREFSVIVVKNENGDRVSGKTAIDPKSFQLLEADLPPLAPGTYHVYWAVVSWDGHRTKGDYTFSVSP
jgi:methionine-rich copper-binding protein CopC